MKNIVFKINKKTAIIIIVAVLGLAVILLSCLVAYLLKTKGISLPRTVVEQSQTGSSIIQKASPAGEAKIYSYGEKISLSGVVKYYQGNTGKNVLALFLDEPINMKAGTNSFEKAYKDQEIFQLLNDNRLPLSQYENQAISVAGILLPMHTAHHQTDVLLSVESIAAKEVSIAKTNTFQGFYTHYDKLDWGDVPVTCDAITVIGGDEGLIAKYKSMVEEGNGINYVDYQGRLVVNLNLDSVDSAARKTITSSTAGLPVEIVVKELILNDAGVPACFSFFEITEVQP